MQSRGRRCARSTRTSFEEVSEQPSRAFRGWSRALLTCVERVEVGGGVTEDHVLAGFEVGAADTPKHLGAVGVSP